MIMPYLEIKVFFHKLVDFEKKLFHILIPVYMSAEMIGIINWASFVLLQIRAKFVTNWGSFIITN